MKSVLSIVSAALLTFCASERSFTDSHEKNVELLEQPPVRSVSSTDLAKDRNEIEVEKLDQHDFISFYAHMGTDWIREITGGTDIFDDEECYPADVSFSDIELNISWRGLPGGALIYSYRLEDEHRDDGGNCVFRTGIAVDIHECIRDCSRSMDYATYPGSSPVINDLSWRDLKTRAEENIHSSDRRWYLVDSQYAYQQKHSFIIKFIFSDSIQTTTCTQIFVYDRAGLTEMTPECVPLEEGDIP